MEVDSLGLISWCEGAWGGPITSAMLPFRDRACALWRDAHSSSCACVRANGFCLDVKSMRTTLWDVRGRNWFAPKDK